MATGVKGLLASNPSHPAIRHREPHTALWEGEQHFDG